MLRPRPSPPIQRPMKPTVYPLERALLLVGAASGVAVTFLILSPLFGFAVFAICVSVGLLWRHAEPPVLPFCLAYQWMFVVSGYLYRHFTGEYPSLAFVGDLDKAVLLSIVGFLVLAVSIRLAGMLLPAMVQQRQRWLRERPANYDVFRLFLAVLAIYSLNYLGDISPRLFFFSTAQIFERLLEFRGVLLFILIATILRNNQGYAYGAAAFLFALIPRFASAQSVFKELFFLLLLALLMFWIPWSPRVEDRRRSTMIASVILAIVVGLGGMGILWEGAIKPIWRAAYRAGDIEGTTTERVAEFSDTFSQATGSFQFGKSLEALAGRLSSGVGYFSHVLEHVPTVVPHEDGKLCMRALRHVVTPRFLFPDKGDLGVDSWLIRIYAGLAVAGEELKTSVGLTYMAQFYIDFGTYGMFFPMAVYGLLIGLLYRSLSMLSPSIDFYAGSITVIFIGHFTSYEGEIAKLLGGLIQSFIIFGAILGLAGPLLHQLFLGRMKKGAAGQDLRGGPARSWPRRPPWAPALAYRMRRPARPVQPRRPQLPKAAD